MKNMLSLGYRKFKRTLCGGAWETFKGMNRLTSVGRLGCCPVGSYMKFPELSPFSIAGSCSLCPAGQFTDDLPNIVGKVNGGVDDTSCKYCPKGYEADGTTTGCQICSFSKVS